MFSVDPKDQSARTRTSRFAACRARTRHAVSQKFDPRAREIRVSYRDPIVRSCLVRLRTFATRDARLTEDASAMVALAETICVLCAMEACMATRYGARSTRARARARARVVRV
jgi:hypothetical protein